MAPKPRPVTARCAKPLLYLAVAYSNKPLAGRAGKPDLEWRPEDFTRARVIDLRSHRTVGRKGLIRRTLIVEP